MSSSAFTPTTTQVTTEVPVNVPVVTKDKLFTPIIGISGTFSSQKGEYQRAGNRMNARVQLSFATVSAINSPYTLTLPDSLTYDGSNIPVSDEPIVGTFSLWDASASYIEFMGTVHVNSSNSLKFKAHGQTAFNNSSTPVTIAANDILEIQFSIPIAEWAGSGTTTLADRALEEYASNSGGQGTAAATSYTNASFVVYGSNGSLIPSVGSTTPDAATEYIVRFQSQILPTDTIILELNRFGSWLPIASGLAGTGAVMYQRQASAYYGIGFNQINGSTTDCLVQFGNYGARPPGPGGSFAGLGETWSTYSSVRWRLRKVSSGSQVGYPISTKNIVGATDGVAPVTGMLGETLSIISTGTLQIPTSSAGDITGMSLSLPPGVWRLTLKASVYMKHSAGSNQTNGISLFITDAGNTIIANSGVQQQVENQPTLGSGLNFVFHLESNSVFVNTTTQTIKMRGFRANLTNGPELLADSSQQRITGIIATRIA
jgi:hypothetical protein